MKVLHLDAATCRNILHRSKHKQTVVTYPHDLLREGQPPTDVVDPGANVGSAPVPSLGSLVGQTVAIARLPRYEGDVWAGMPVTLEWPGAIVGSARVEACVPIVDNWPNPTDDVTRPPYIRVMGYGGRLVYADAKGKRHRISGQLPFADFTPGRTALILADAASCEQRCPWCLGGFFDANGVWVACPVCGAVDDGRSESTCAPIPYDASGPISEWTP